MAKVQPKHRKPAKKIAPVLFESMPEKANFMIILAGLAVIILGYFLMERGGMDDALALVIGPVVLVIGYCLVVPFGILYRRKEQKQ